MGDRPALKEHHAGTELATTWLLLTPGHHTTPKYTLPHLHTLHGLLTYIHSMVSLTYIHSMFSLTYIHSMVSLTYIHSMVSYSVCIA